MNFLNFSAWLLLVYIIYYVVNIVFDIFFSKQNIGKKDNNEKSFSIELEEEEVTNVRNIEPDEEIEAFSLSEQKEDHNSEIEMVFENRGIPVDELAKSSIFKNIAFY